ncbi:MAG: hypothetical protein MUE49_10175 [Rhodospirillales bacterium]|jgi:hypothetical protein|nr:hypothetical protein [Rhodospirillales bacterium]
MPDGNEAADADHAASRRRLRALAAHLICGTAASVALVVADVAQNRLPTWSPLVIVGWGGILALHVGYVMGLFDTLRRPRRGGRQGGDTGR